MGTRQTIFCHCLSACEGQWDARLQVVGRSSARGLDLLLSIQIVPQGQLNHGFD